MYDTMLNICLIFLTLADRFIINNCLNSFKTNILTLSVTLTIYNLKQYLNRSSIIAGIPFTCLFDRGCNFVIIWDVKLFFEISFIIEPDRGHELTRVPKLTNRFAYYNNMLITIIYLYSSDIDLKICY